jgi:phage protein D
MALDADSLYGQAAPGLRIQPIPSAGPRYSADTFANKLNRPRRLRAVASVLIGGQDVTAKFDPYLISISVTDKLAGIDEASIALDDRYGRIQLPDDNASIVLRFGWPGENAVTSFQGKISDIESYAQKRSGRRLLIQAQGLDQFESGKAQRSQTWGDNDQEGKTFGEVMNELASSEKWGKVTVHPDIASIRRKVWAMSNESPMSFAFRITRELGANLKVADGTWGISPGEGFQSATGETLPAIIGAVGKNVMAWRVKPMQGRPQYKQTSSHWFDPEKGKWLYNIAQVKNGGGGMFGEAKATHLAPSPAGDADHAKQVADGSAFSSFAGRGTGWVVIDGEPAATAGGPFVLSGARQGVDNSYRMEEVEQTYHRGGGFTSRLQVDSTGTSVPITGQVPVTDIGQ